MIPIARPLMGEAERDLVWSTLASGALAQGDRVRELEERFAAYLGVEHAVATSSGTTALHLAVLAHGIGPGDEVITVPFTFIASANVIGYVGATPVFVDVDPETFTMDVAQAEAAITPRTRAILPVDLYGHPADLPALADLAERRGLLLIDDACQAHGADISGRRVGTWGTAAFSFYPTKNMTTGEGGMVTTGDAALAERVRLLREHGMRIRYHHELVGYNFRMTDVHASIGLAQLPRLDGFNGRRRAIAARYLRELKGVGLPMERSGARHVYHQFTLRVPARNAFAETLRARGVGSAVYYPIPVHRQAPYAALGYDRQRFPVSERLSEEVLSIPVHPGLSDAEVDEVVAAVNETADEVIREPQTIVRA